MCGFVVQSADAITQSKGSPNTLELSFLDFFWFKYFHFGIKPGFPQ